MWGILYSMIDIHNFSGRLGNEMFRHAYLYSQARDGVIPDVYVQDERYFEKYADEIKTLFGSGIGFLPYVAIHVRRGDYVNNKFYVDLSQTDYYEQAIAMFPGKKFLVFSDDVVFAKKRFPSENFQVMEGGTELEDFNQMASCEHQIIANSSFSWWAAYLNPNPSKIVVAPSVKHWYTDNVERTICPKNWRRI